MTPLLPRFNDFFTACMVVLFVGCVVSVGASWAAGAWQRLTNKGEK